ncbi:MAG: permease [Acidobacteriota bacterium]
MISFLLNILKEIYFLFIDISPFLLIGFLFAGLFHTLLGEGYIKKHFSKSGIFSTIKATILGIPLPVCSCGVIPIAESLRRDGASKSSTMAFLVSTPSSGIDSIFATYALMGPVYAVFRPLASLFSGIVVGIATHFEGNGKEEKISVTPEKKAKKSFKDIFVYGFKVLPSEIAQWLIIGVVIGGIISAMLPSDFGSSYLTTPFLHYLIILLISIPVYVCATGSIPIAASLLIKGILPGAVLAFLIAGPATNTVTMSFVYKRLGKRVAVVYLLSIILVSLGLGLIFDRITGSMDLDILISVSHGGGLSHTIKVVSAIIMLLLFLNSRYDMAGKMIRVKEKDMERIKVSDITCDHCKMAIEKTLGSIPGIGTFRVSVENREVVFDGKAGVEDVKTQIKESGYNPE